MERTENKQVNSFSQYINVLSRWLERIGAISIFGIVLIPCLDILGGKLFNTPVPGSYEIVVFCQLLGISLAMAGSLLRGSHVSVQILDTLLSRRFQGLLNTFVYLLGLGLFSTLAWQSIKYGHVLKDAGEVSGTIGIPFYPFAYALGLSCIPVCLIFIIYLVNSLKTFFGK